VRINLKKKILPRHDGLFVSLFRYVSTQKKELVEQITDLVFYSSSKILFLKVWSMNNFWFSICQKVVWEMTKKSHIHTGGKQVNKQNDVRK